MTLFQYIGDNLDRVKFDTRIGLISCATLKSFRVYSRFDYYRRTGETVSMSVFYVADEMDVSIGWVYSIIKKMESEI